MAVQLNAHRERGACRRAEGRLRVRIEWIVLRDLTGVVDREQEQVPCLIERVSKCQLISGRERLAVCEDLRGPAMLYEDVKAVAALVPDSRFAAQPNHEQSGGGGDGKRSRTEPARRASHGAAACNHPARKGLWVASLQERPARIEEGLQAIGALRASLDMRAPLGVLVRGELLELMPR